MLVESAQLKFKFEMRSSKDRSRNNIRKGYSTFLDTSLGTIQITSTIVS